MRRTSEIQLAKNVQKNGKGRSDCWFCCRRFADYRSYKHDFAREWALGRLGECLADRDCELLERVFPEREKAQLKNG